MEWFAERGISEAVLRRNRVGATARYMVETGKEQMAVTFPYFRNGDLINIKYRARPKAFQMVAGAELIFWGLDDCAKAEEIVIVEGEMDKLAVEEATGRRSVLSVPNGAGAAQMGYMEEDAAAQILGSARRVILAVDGDAPGQALRDELARRIGRERCWTVEWPEGTKDANDVLVKYGREALSTVLRSASAFPIEGVLRVDDVWEDVLSLYESGLPRGLSTGWSSVDQGYTVGEAQVTIVTGAPGSGKSEWLDCLLANLATQHGWSFAVFSPENHPVHLHVAKLAAKALAKPFEDRWEGRMTVEELNAVRPWLHEIFHFIAPESPTVEEVLSAARQLILRHGVRGLVIDPFNRFEHKRPRELTETEYIGQFLTACQRFAKGTGCHIWIVAHPTKLQKNQDGTYPVARPWDISGSSNWFNMADNCISVARDKENTDGDVDIHIQKIRHRWLGGLGIATVKYQPPTGTYRDWGWQKHG
jgi:twinkle protein